MNALKFWLAASVYVVGATLTFGSLWHDVKTACEYMHPRDCRATIILGPAIGAAVWPMVVLGKAGIWIMSHGSALSV